MQSEEGSNAGQRGTDKQLGPQRRAVNGAGALQHVCFFTMDLSEGHQSHFAQEYQSVLAKGRAVSLLASPQNWDVILQN